MAIAGPQFNSHPPQVIQPQVINAPQYPNYWAGLLPGVVGNMFEAGMKHLFPSAQEEYYTQLGQGQKIKNEQEMLPQLSLWKALREDAATQGRADQVSMYDQLINSHAPSAGLTPDTVASTPADQLSVQARNQFAGQTNPGVGPDASVAGPGAGGGYGSLPLPNSQPTPQTPEDQMRLLHNAQRLRGAVELSNYYQRGQFDKVTPQMVEDATMGFDAFTMIKQKELEAKGVPSMFAKYLDTPTIADYAGGFALLAKDPEAGKNALATAEKNLRTAAEANPFMRDHPQMVEGLIQQARVQGASLAQGLPGLADVWVKKATVPQIEAQTASEIERGKVLTQEARLTRENANIAFQTGLLKANEVKYAEQMSDSDLALKKAQVLNFLGDYRYKMSEVQKSALVAKYADAEAKSLIVSRLSGSLAALTKDPTRQADIQQATTFAQMMKTVNDSITESAKQLSSLANDGSQRALERKAQLEQYITENTQMVAGIRNRLNDFTTRFNQTEALNGTLSGPFVAQIAQLMGSGWGVDPQGGLQYNPPIMPSGKMMDDNVNTIILKMAEQDRLKGKPLTPQQFLDMMTKQVFPQYGIPPADYETYVKRYGTELQGR